MKLSATALRAGRASLWKELPCVCNLPATMDELANRTGLLGANYPLWPFWHPNDGATQWGESGSAIGAVWLFRSSFHLCLPLDVK